MISIYRCRLVNERWERIERYHVDRSFATMAEGIDFAEALNVRTWPRFDWLLGPVEAYLASRIQEQVSPCEAEDVEGASEEK